MINLINDTINKEDMDALSDWIKTYPRLTKGDLTKRFEYEFAKWMGVKYGVFVNSGSSANLIMIYTLIIAKLLKNNKVVVPSLCWITDIAPIIQFGLTPVLCDCNLNNLSVDICHLERIFQTEKPAALLLVSILGFSPDMDAIVKLCMEYDVLLLEDNCESLGSRYESFFGNDCKLGTFGLMSSTSMYFGHHISTIEGGMVFTNNDKIYNILLSLRSHGWNRDWDIKSRIEIEKKYGVNGINSMYTFYYPGLNVRSTDLQAFIGLNQLKRLDDIIEKRNKNYKFYMENLNCLWKPIEIEGSFTSNFAYPIISSEKNRLVRTLDDSGVETRPLVCGSMGTQPFYKELFGEKVLDNCEIVDKYGIYLPNHPGLSDEDIKFICTVVNNVIEEECI